MLVACTFPEGEETSKGAYVVNTCASVTSVAGSLGTVLRAGRYCRATCAVAK